MQRISHERILITGAGGSIGSALALRVAALQPRELVLLEVAETPLIALQHALQDIPLPCPPRYLLGSVLNRSLLDEVFDLHQPTLVFHAAAYKHVPLMEEQPFAAIENNVFGTDTLATSAARSRARIILLSTDKAVEPASIMGATKRVAEKIILESGGTAVRLGNVVASSASVAELFAAQITAGGPITVTDPAARRYFLTIEEAVHLLLASAAAEPGLYAADLHDQHFIADLARFLARQLAPHRDIAIEFTAPRAGDKECEKLASTTEISETSNVPGLRAIHPRQKIPNDLRRDLRMLRAATDARDLPASLDALQTLVPEFTPSAALRAMAQRQSSRASL